jgi:ankyrin repeat protein
LDNGAFPALVNNEGDTPMDLAEDFDEIVEMLQENIDRNMIDVDAVRGVEAELMLEDANRLKNDPALTPAIGYNGATPLHVAASKDYLQVVK